MRRKKRDSESWDWKEEPLRFAPAQQVLLCEHCWNGQHWRPAYRDQYGTRHAKTKNCLENGCRCGCIHDLYRAPKFTGEGQTEIPMNNPLEIK
jgi:hypothetical protein